MIGVGGGGNKSLLFLFLIFFVIFSFQLLKARKASFSLCAHEGIPHLRSDILATIYQ